MKICMIITAAGTSSRQKQNKLLMRSCNETIIEKTIYTFTNFGLDLFVVVGYQRNEILPILKHRFGTDINIVSNDNYLSGIASSIKKGIFNAGDGYDYYGFCNGDKPFIKKSTVQKIIEYTLINKPKILVPLYQDKSGHPTFFSKMHLKDFGNLKGDVGGIEIINKFPGSVTYYPINDEGTVIDMDKYLSQNNEDNR